MRLKYFVFGVLSALSLGGVIAGTNSLQSVSGGIVRKAHVNQYYTAMNQDVVPRDSSGAATDLAGNLGSNSYRWNYLISRYATMDQINLASAGVNLTTNTTTNNTGLVSSGGLDGLFFPTGSSNAGLMGLGPRTLGVRTSGSASTYDLVVAPHSAGHGDVSVHGRVVGGAGSLTLDIGNGYTVTRNSIGNCTLTFAQPFASTPSVVGSAENSGTFRFLSATTSTATIILYDITASLNDMSFSFIATGERGD